MRKNAKTINDEYYHGKGYNSKDLNIRGKPKRGLASFQIEEKLWKEFDEQIEKEHGRYKKSYIIESLIREYMAVKKSGCVNSEI
jgi:predicted AlkP superfamily phosphohydrolase/phosphomutase